MLFDAEGRVRRTAQVELTQLYPQPGWVEHDPEEIWRSVVETCREAAAAADGPIAAIGIANQRETTLLWERATGRPVHNAIVWQDRRTADLCERWRGRGARRSGRRAHRARHRPLFFRLQDLLAARQCAGAAPRAEAGEIAFGTIDSFLLWRLSGGKRHATDVTNAARTMLYDIGRLDWDAELLDLFQIPRAILPEVLDTGADYGGTAPELLGGAIPIAALAGDQQAALIGQGCFRPGLVKSTYGTGAFALLNIGGAPVRSRHRLLTTIGYRLRRRDGLCARRQHLCRGCGGAMAARPARHHRDRRRDGRAGRPRRPAAAALSGAGLCRARRAPLGARCARRADRADGRMRPARDRPRRPRSSRLPDPRPRRGDGGRCRDRGHRPCASTAAWRRTTGRCSFSPTSCRPRSSARPRSRPPPGARPMSPG